MRWGVHEYEVVILETFDEILNDFLFEWCYIQSRDFLFDNQKNVLVHLERRKHIQLEVKNSH